MVSDINHTFYIAEWMDDSADLLAELARLQICNVCEIWMIYHLGTIHALWEIRKNFSSISLSVSQPQQ